MAEKPQSLSPMNKREYKKQWYENNRDKILAQRREHYYANREKNISYSTTWNRDNKEKRAAINQKWKQDNRIKINAHAILKDHIDRGNIQRGRCAVCGVDKNIQGHHEEYSRPLNVVWLCPRHHAARHRQLDIMI